MKHSATKHSTTGNNVLSESRKRLRRKRHRKKARISNLKNKKQGKFHIPYKTVKSNFQPFNSEMSNWYWSNYKKALEWQDRHKIAYWKSCALALLEENRHLLHIINQTQPGLHPDVSVTNQFLKNRFHAGGPKQEHVDVSNTQDDSNENDDEEDEIEFELSEEMLKFFEQSHKHKMEMKKVKEEELLHKAEDEINQMHNNKLKRSTEMNLLYGEGASMIIGMETALQLSYEKYCDTKSPKFWPNIPFRL